MAKQHSLLLGAHMSIAGGIDKSIAQGESIGCTAIQIFTKSNRQWRAKKITDQDADVFKKAWKESSIHSVFAHATYLINIGSPDSAIEKKSVNALIEEMERCELLGLPYLVLHPGSRGTMDEDKCLEQIASNLDQVLTKVPGHSMILLETMAGQGSSVCSTFEQLGKVRKATEHKHRIGICLDTCHVFAAGYDLRTSKTYNALWNDFDRHIGLSHLKAMHINDSKNDLGSRVDRHADIGKGKLGLESFSLLFNDPTFFDIPKVLETPKKEGLKEDLHNMNTIMKLLSAKTKKLLHV